VLPETVDGVRYDALSSTCFMSSNLVSITIPEGVGLCNSIFAHSQELESVVLPSTLTRIPYELFGDCPSLTSITVPAGVTSIEGIAFGGCTTLETVTYLGTVAQWNAIEIAGNAFENTPCLYAITCTDGVVEL
ncbi:MAG: leucine-rich repeat domain-containing protein, partial [Spirochaetales bacterium]|nr:leucine-rich repeat domain-containing protein [Candidatus Physcosoma equi]